MVGCKISKHSELSVHLGIFKELKNTTENQYEKMCEMCASLLILKYLVSLSFGGV